MDILTVKSEELCVGDVANNDGVVIRPGEVCYAIEKLVENVANNSRPSEVRLFF